MVSNQVAGGFRVVGGLRLDGGLDRDRGELVLIDQPRNALRIIRPIDLGQTAERIVDVVRRLLIRIRRGFELAVARVDAMARHLLQGVGDRRRIGVELLIIASGRRPSQGIDGFRHVTERIVAELRRDPRGAFGQGVEEPPFVFGQQALGGGDGVHGGLVIVQPAFLHGLTVGVLREEMAGVAHQPVSRVVGVVDNRLPLITGGVDLAPVFHADGVPIGIGGELGPLAFEGGVAVRDDSRGVIE